jgi:putative flippase GtrA
VYLVRTFELEMSNRTFKRSHADFHRFLVAGIAGAVVGFFSNFAINTGTSVSPLAIAFLAGYAVDIFFSFLEGLMQAFARDRNMGGAPPPVEM